MCVSAPPDCSRFYELIVRNDGTALSLVSESAIEVDWAPDDTAYVFTEGDASCDPRPSPLIVGRPEEEPSLISPDDVEEGNPDWSPDGRSIVFNGVIE
jgi:Tol biopolymer transport system component